VSILGLLEVKSEAPSARTGGKLVLRRAMGTVGPSIFRLRLAPSQKGTSAASSHKGEAGKNAKTGLSGGLRFAT
jgi:hypothetical protein